MHRFPSLLVLAAALALAGCASGAASQSPPVKGAAGQLHTDARQRRADADRQEPEGRFSGIRYIQFGAQRTQWVMHCPPGLPSYSRGYCTLTRDEP